jgi:hypothetical protein
MKYDHDYYHLALADGRMPYTRISRPADRKHGYGKDIWRQILRLQLEVSEDEFWACVQDGVKPNRGEPKAPREALPASLAWQLKNQLGLSDAEIGKLTRAEAVERMQQHWMSGG